MEGISQHKPSQFRCHNINHAHLQALSEIPFVDPHAKSALSIPVESNHQTCSTCEQKSECVDHFQPIDTLGSQADVHIAISSETNDIFSVAEEYPHTTAHADTSPQLPQMLQSVPQLEGKIRIKELVAKFERHADACPISKVKDNKPPVSREAKAASRDGIISGNGSGVLVHPFVPNSTPLSVTQLKHYFENFPPLNTSEQKGSSKSVVPDVETRSTAVLLQQFESVDIASRYGKAYRRQREASSVPRKSSKSATCSTLTPELKSSTSNTCPVLANCDGGDFVPLADSPSGKTKDGHCNVDSPVKKVTHDFPRSLPFGPVAEEVPFISRGTYLGTDSDPYDLQNKVVNLNKEGKTTEFYQKPEVGYDVMVGSERPLNTLDGAVHEGVLSSVGVPDAYNEGFHQTVALPEDGADVLPRPDASSHLIGSPSTRIERLASMVAVNVQNYGKPLPRRLLTRANTRGT